MTTVSSFSNLNQESFVFTTEFGKDDFITLCNTQLTVPNIKSLHASLKGSSTKKRNPENILNDIFDDLDIAGVRIAIGMIKLLLQMNSIDNSGSSGMQRNNSPSNPDGASNRSNGSSSPEYTSDEIPSSELSIANGVQFEIEPAVFMKQKDNDIKPVKYLSEGKVYVHSLNEDNVPEIFDDLYQSLLKHSDVDNSPYDFGEEVAGYFIEASNVQQQQNASTTTTTTTTTSNTSNTSTNNQQHIYL